MPKIPRDISGRSFTKLLEEYGYETIRETGSHIRLVSSFNGIEHKITIPNHKYIKIGTLNNILSDIANYLEVSKERLIIELFGKE